MTTLSHPNHLGFCKRPNDQYIEQLNRECASDTALPEISYRYQTEEKTQTVAERIFSCLYAIVTYPYRVLQRLASKIIVPVSNGFLSNFTFYRSQENLNVQMQNMFIMAMLQAGRTITDSNWKYKRISIDVDGMTIDAMLIVRNSTAENGKWILLSDGNGQIYESHKPYFSDAKQLAFSLDANVLVFNYPGVGASQGTPLPETIAKTYKAMLRFLEDKGAGIGAKTIIGHGFSLGGAAQALGLDSHTLDPDINYVFVKDRTFSTLSKAATDVMGPWAGKLVEFLGWNMDTETASKKLKAHELILQSTEKIGQHGKIRVRNDGAITARASLAEAFCNQREFDRFKKTKRLISLSNKSHNDFLNREELLMITQIIENAVQIQISDRAAALAHREEAI